MLKRLANSYLNLSFKVCDWGCKTGLFINLLSFEKNFELLTGVDIDARYL